MGWWLEISFVRRRLRHRSDTVSTKRERSSCAWLRELKKGRHVGSCVDVDAFSCQDLVEVIDVETGNVTFQKRITL
jgi:hypothetical protein